MDDEDDAARQKFPESGDDLHLNEFQVQKYRF